MRIEPAQPQAVAAVTRPPVEPWMKKQVEESFQRVKTAILRGNFSAYLAEIHPEVLKHRKVEDLAIHFGELKQTGVRDWELDTLQRDREGVGAIVKNAPKNTVAFFLFEGKDQLKFAYLGPFSIP